MPSSLHRHHLPLFDFADGLFADREWLSGVRSRTSGGQVADDLECLFGGLDRPEDGLLNPEQRESQLILGELEYFLAPLVLKLTPCLEQLAQLRIVRRDLTRELPPGLEVVAASGRVQEEAAGEGADLLARSII